MAVLFPICSLVLWTSTLIISRYFANHRQMDPFRLSAFFYFFFVYSMYDCVNFESKYDIWITNKLFNAVSIHHSFFYISFETKTVISLLILFDILTISVLKMNLSWPHWLYGLIRSASNFIKFKMGTKSPGVPQRCRLILQQCLAIQLTKPGHTPEDFWMYDSGYMIFQVSNLYL